MIYISGPITGTDDYMERFENAEKELTSKGFNIINPARYNAQLPSDEVNHYGYMHVSLALLHLCSKIYMIDGWENSKGARLEHAYAEAIGKEIIYQTPPTEKEAEKKYHWRIANFPAYVYLNANVRNNTLTIGGNVPTTCYDTAFTVGEYKVISIRHGFPEDMFVKEEIE